MTMRPHRAASGAAFALVFGSGAARAATLNVGAGQTYATPCAAIAAAQPNDEIDVAPGTYTDSCEINTAGITLKGVGGQPKIDLSGTDHPADYKGIYVVSGDDVTIENLELTGANIPVTAQYGGNGAALRIQGNGVVVHGCFIHDNQDGILATPNAAGGTLTIEYTELSNNGLGNACDVTSCVHNVYVGTGAGGNFAKLVFQFNWDHSVATDTPDKGHLLKSRALESDVLYNRLTGEAGHDSYEVDLPNGGLAIVVGNIIEKGPNPDNQILLDYGEEGYGSGTNALYVVNNTFVNDDTSASNPIFIDVAGGGTLTAHDNIFAGHGTPSSTGALSADNLSGVDPLFVNPSAYDYHLQSTSPAIGKAVAPGTAGSVSLVPVFEYVQPLASAPRASDDDLGAFEYASGDAGGPTADGGAATDGGGELDAGGGVGTQGHGGSTPAAAGDSGCGCATAGRDGAAPWALFLAGAASLALVSRRRRA